ncbi:MAG: electron transfer flavoprotein subunit beta/FixA family protein [Anaerolineae bacterium]
MNIVATVKLVPDLVEELEIDESGAALDMTWMRLIINEFDDHAIEQGVLLKERGGGHLTVVVPDVEGADDVLFAAAAKGADRLIKLTDDFEKGVNNHALARALAPIVKELKPDLVLTGVQTHEDLDGSVGPLLAELLGMPYVGYVSGVTVNEGTITVRKEYPGGLIAQMQVTLPALLGIQAADEPPRYVPISKIRQAMKDASIEEQAVADLDPSGGPTITRMFERETAERATMIEGDEEEIADRLVEIFQEAGIL